MLNEKAPIYERPTAIQNDDQPSFRSEPVLERQNTQLQIAVREAVAAVFTVESEDFPSGPSRVTAVFRGKLKVDADVAYDQLDAALAPRDQLPIFRWQGKTHVVEVVNGRVVRAVPRSWLPSFVLGVLTLFCLFYVGAGIAREGALLLPSDISVEELANGWPYALAMLLVLGAHEWGHIWAARRNNINLTPPLFIPFPLTILGTLGSIIQFRTLARDRRALFDVSAAGPLAGLLVAIPLLIVGLLTADVYALPVESAYDLEGNSLLYIILKLLVFGQVLPDGRVNIVMNQLLLAGWSGLAITGLSLMPIGVLAGGNILYALVGDRLRWLYLPVTLSLIGLATLVSEVWFFWVFLAIVFGRRFTLPLNDITPLGDWRKIAVIAMMVLLVLLFVPNPLHVVDPIELPSIELF